MKRKRKTLISILWAIATLVSWLAFWWLETSASQKVFYSISSVFVLYLIFSVVIKEFGINHLRDSKTRYAFRKSVSVFLVVVIFVVLLRIWIPNPQALLVAYGVVAAGIAVALQDVVKNFAGGILIFVGGLYQVGNRVQINNTFGDVIDVGLFNTTLLEVGEWINADQATGRITTVPNGIVLTDPVQNYTKHHKFLWDEVVVVITSQSNWREAMRILGEVGHKYTKEFISEADKSLTRLERYYYIEGHILDPNVYIKSHDNGYEITLRYVVNAWKRRSTSSHIWEDLIQKFEENTSIEIAPETYSVIDYPEVKRSKVVDSE